MAHDPDRDPALQEAGAPASPYRPATELIAALASGAVSSVELVDRLMRRWRGVSAGRCPGCR
jgi:hypothetical protein